MAVSIIAILDLTRFIIDTKIPIIALQIRIIAAARCSPLHMQPELHLVRVATLQVALL
jgi:hypothetical protein